MIEAVRNRALPALFSFCLDSVSSNNAKTKPYEAQTINSERYFSAWLFAIVLCSRSLRQTSVVFAVPVASSIDVQLLMLRKYHNVWPMKARMVSDFACKTRLRFRGPYATDSIKPLPLSPPP